MRLSRRAVMRICQRLLISLTQTCGKIRYPVRRVQVRLRDNHGSVVIYFNFCLVGTAVSLIPFILAPRLPHTALDWLLITGIIAISVAAQLLMHHGFRYCRSWEGGLLMTSELIYASIFGIIFLSEPATWRFWVGGLMIIASAVTMNIANHNNGIKVKIHK